MKEIHSFNIVLYDTYVLACTRTVQTHRQKERQIRPNQFYEKSPSPVKRALVLGFRLKVEGLEFRI